MSDAPTAFAIAKDAQRGTHCVQRVVRRRRDANKHSLVGDHTGSTAKTMSAARKRTGSGPALCVANCHSAPDTQNRSGWISANHSCRRTARIRDAGPVTHKNHGLYRQPATLNRRSPASGGYLRPFKTGKILRPAIRRTNLEKQPQTRMAETSTDVVL